LPRHIALFFFFGIGKERREKLKRSVQYNKGIYKSVGFMANEWNYRMVKRDESYEKFEAQIRKSMVAHELANGAGGKS